ncbi:MAG: hypothetical protein ABI047_03255 [Jatrophihabitantaceae bacterium]
MTQASYQNTPLYAAVTDLRAEIANVKSHPAAPALRFDGVDAALDRLATVAAAAQAEPTAEAEPAPSQLAEVDPPEATVLPPPAQDEPTGDPARRPPRRG